MTDDIYYVGFVTMKRWLENRNAGKSLAEYFKEHRYRRVGIYGAGDLGRLLLAELQNSDVEVVFFVDRNAEGLVNINSIPVITLDAISNNKHIDALIVTTMDVFDQICAELIGIAPEIAVISIRDAVYEL